MKWFNKIIGEQVQQEMLRQKAREAAQKLPPPAPMVTGPNVLAHPTLRAMDAVMLRAVEPKNKKSETKMPLVVMILGVVGQLVDGLITQGMKQSWPKDLIDAIISASNAIAAAHTLAVTKAGLEAARQ